MEAFEQAVKAQSGRCFVRIIASLLAGARIRGGCLYEQQGGPTYCHHGDMQNPDLPGQRREDSRQAARTR